MSVILQFPTSQDVKRTDTTKSGSRKIQSRVEIIVFPIN